MQQLLVTLVIAVKPVNLIILTNSVRLLAASFASGSVPFILIIVNTPPPASPQYSSLILHPHFTVHSRITLSFCLGNWLDPQPHLHPTLSPSPSSLIQRDSVLQRAVRTWFAVKGRGVMCGLCWPCTDTLIHWHFYEPEHHLLKELFLESCWLLCHRQPLCALSISLFPPVSEACHLGS